MVVKSIRMAGCYQWVVATVTTTTTTIATGYLDQKWTHSLQSSLAIVLKFEVHAQILDDSRGVMVAIATTIAPWVGFVCLLPTVPPRAGIQLVYYKVESHFRDST